MILSELDKKIEALHQQVEESAAKHHILLGRLLQLKEIQKYAVEINVKQIEENQNG